MYTFKQYHDDEMVFHRETKINFGQCGDNHLLSLTELLLLTSDTAVEDYHERGLTWQFLDEHEVAILVSRLSLHIVKFPMANDVIHVATWEETPEGPQLFRAYEIRDEKGNLLVSGRSSWLVVNPVTRRIIKPSQFTLREPPVKVTPYDGIPCGRIPTPENLKEVDTRPVRYSDIDGNGHTNNSRYGAFIVDALPDEYQHKVLKDIKINYSKEAVKGVMLTLSLAYSEDGKKVTVLGKQGDTTCFESELYY